MKISWIFWIRAALLIDTIFDLKAPKKKEEEENENNFFDVRVLKGMPDFGDI